MTAFIGEITTRARQEAVAILEHEREAKRRHRAAIAWDPIERAAYNIEILNSWMRGNPNLHEYFERTHKTVVIYDPIWYMVVNLGMNRANIRLLAQGVCVEVEVRISMHWTKITKELMTTWWDAGDSMSRRVINNLANLDREKIVVRMMKTIHD